MELYPPPRLNEEPCERYAGHLPLSADHRRRLLQHAGGESNARESMVRLHEALAGRTVDPENPSYASIMRRLELVYGIGSGSAISEDAQHRVRLATTPPLNRTSMAPQAWPGAARRRR
ncbi:MAG: hypothetical protein KIT18_13380, partial [Burkholderiales bacterium]|nr:hypothetical protein [Burkholderiales bacterium]